jgi:hypothetical protein
MKEHLLVLKPIQYKKHILILLMDQHGTFFYGKLQIKMK